jgi:hypothetical protein
MHPRFSAWGELPLAPHLFSAICSAYVGTAAVGCPVERSSTGSPRHRQGNIGTALPPNLGYGQFGFITAAHI